MKKYFNLVVLIMVFSCSREDPRVFNIDWAVTIRQDPGLSKVASRLEYIPLESSDTCMISKLSQFYIAGDRILVISLLKKQFPLLFDRTGRFLRCLEVPGVLDGKMKYTIQDVAIDSISENISLYTRNSVYVFDNEGNLIEQDSVPEAFLEQEDVRYFYLGHTRHHRVHVSLCEDSCFFNFTEISSNRKTNFFINNRALKVPEHKLPSGEVIKKPLDVTNFYFYENYVAYYDLVCSCYCRVYPDGRIEYPYEFKCSWQNEANIKSGIWQLLETSNCFFTQVSRGKPYRFVYFKDRDRLQCLKLKRNGFVNDIDHGPEFWPDGQTLDGRLYMQRSAKWFKESCRKSKNPKIQELANHIGYYDNPVIIIATPK